MTASTCAVTASRARRWPIASATAPPTPVSISSKTRVGADALAASATFNASMKRASSPPDAIFISGPGRVPGLVATQKLTASIPSGPGDSGSTCVVNRARSSLSGASSALTAVSSAAAACRRRSDNASACRL